MINKQIAEIFIEIAQILEIKGDNPFRIRAYQRAAQNIESLPEDIKDMMKQGRLREIPGIGKDLQERIEEFIKTGKLKHYEKLKKSIPSGLLDLLDIPGLGPKTVKLFYDKVKIKNIRDLEKAISDGKLLRIEGVREKTVENIKKGIKLISRSKERLPLAEATEVSEYFIGNLRKLKEIKNICLAGSLRRQKETVRDIDILAISSSPEKIMDKFTSLDEVKRIQAKGETKASILTKHNAQVDLRVLDSNSFGAALLYFTGSKQFNIKLRQLAQKKKLKVNEYGVFKGNKFVAGRTEEEIFRLFNMPYIEPELREDTGEFELALKHKLPSLIELEDIKGDLHVHSKWSDGDNSILEIAQVAKDRGYEYIAISDHSRSLRIAGGLSKEELIQKKKEIDKINKKISNFRVLFGTEVEIDSDGKIDYTDNILKEFDVVIGAVHSGFKQSEAQLTKRIVNACKNKYVHIIAHPTGRHFGVRDSYELDFAQVFKAAKETNTFMEINSFPVRLDLNDSNIRRANEFGVKFAICTDAHAIGQLELIKFGLSMARRGWLSKKDVINTYSLNNLLKTLNKK